jgi:hypothetical protein
MTPEEDRDHAAAPRPCFNASFEWASVTSELADVILRHADMRGNIIAGADAAAGENDFAKLMKPTNWYNSWQHVWGDVYNTYRALDASIKTGGSEAEAVKVMIALLKPHQRAGVVVGGLGPLPAAGGQSWEAVKTYIETTSGWNVHGLIEGALKQYGDTSRTDEPLTAFDIALLGGLHPRTYAIELNAKAKRDDKAADKDLAFKMDEFFELCMEYFDSNGTGAEDLGFRIFLTPLVRRSMHTSYLPFRRTEEEKTQLVSFGARSRSTVVPKGDSVAPGNAKADPGTGRSAGPTLPTTRYTDFSFETYCDQCFERGAEMYIRLVHVMVKSHLEALRRIEPAPEVLTPFAKLIGLTIQRAELLNPLIKMGANASYNRDMRRNNNRATTEARVQLARACGFHPDIYLEGYTLD